MNRKTPAPPGTVVAGTLFEYRTARLRFCQGNFVRRSLDIWPASLEGDKLAELDCLATTFDPQLRRAVEVIECKTRERGSGEVDRVVWLKGIGSLVGAQSVTFAKLNVAGRTRDLARRLVVSVLDEAAMATAERDLGLTQGEWPGFHDPDFGEAVVKPARAGLNAVTVRRAGKYLYGSYWFADDFTRIKQLRTLFRLLTENATSLPADAFRLGIGEATVLFTLAMFSIAAWRYQLAESEFRQLVSDELSTGFGDARGLRSLLRTIDDRQREQFEAIHRAYQDQGVARVIFPVRSLETEVLTPPEWVDAFIDLLSRFVKRPHIATDLIRWADLWAAQLLGKPIGQQSSKFFLSSSVADLQAGLELITAFLERVWGVPKIVHATPQSSAVAAAAAVEVKGRAAQKVLALDATSTTSATPEGEPPPPGSEPATLGSPPESATRATDGRERPRSFETGEWGGQESRRQ